ncbi:energy transducer TonB [Vreelandella arcis]|uniref:Protein TonB n=1 Tax=Vreelandella arcis TaxID=416873 RepID=A0A1G9ZQD3_9GAMM|nr:energy transducer TonB [Halomonas arcis]SDN23589.1 protein TonB [Halomonas arcis]
MIRQALSLVGGGVLAIGLFWLLALLVAPPDDRVEPPEETIAMSMVEAPEEAPQEEAPPPEANQAATPAPSAPVPTPEPPPVADSTIALPDVELPEMPEEPVEMDSELPELTEATPEPEPRPEPEPQPEPEPEPTPTDVATESQTETSDAKREAAPEVQQAESNEPVNVGQATPTSRVNPTYPARAQRRGMEGYVEVTFTIRRDGSVDGSSIRITDAQPGRVFDDAAREAIGRWQFEPSSRLRNATQRIEFQLR